MRRLSVAVVGVALLSAAACGSSSSSGQTSKVNDGAQAASVGNVHVHWHTVVSGLSSPVAVTNAGDGRLFITQQAGAVRVVRSGHLLASPYLDITNEVKSGGEQGFLSVAFHPDFAAHPTMYAAYTRSNGDLVVSSFTASSAKADHVSASTEKHILIVPHHRATNHNGGQLFFGNDGDLYITTGDGGSEGDPYKLADVRTNLTGKILRINVDKTCGKKAYCIPASNPYAHSKKFRQEIIAWGLRNPWRVSIDKPTNTLWIADVGQDKYEEIDHVGVPAAHDFGWSCKEGNSTYDAGECAGRHITPPIHVIPHSPGGNCAVIGGDVYRGHKYASVAGGLYIYSDNCSGRVWGLRKAGGKWQNAQIGSLSGAPSDIGLSHSGEVYAVTLDGVLHRASFSKK
jgi:glucose/arabinose dehydrogenase